ncbi:MAG: hypothetical protein P8Z37_05440 [Acidobacteriota bacterium]|jgi:hypothetical protein
MKGCSLFFCFMLMLPLCAAFSGEKKDSDEKVNQSIKGVWTIVEMDIGSGDNKETTVPKAFMLYIMDKYYSSIRDLSQKTGSTSSGGAYGTSRSFMADAGTYEYDGTTFVVHHLVSMMGGGGASMTFGCKMEGNDILILSPQYDKLVMPGINATSSAKGKVSDGGMAVRYKFKRLE